jgi:hypothetical protein
MLKTIGQLFAREWFREADKVMFGEDDSSD